LNAHPSIRDNFDPDSYISEESDLQEQKHHFPKTSTDEGTIILIKPVLRNSHFSIRDNIDPDSNVIDESDLQSESRSETDVNDTPQIGSISFEPQSAGRYL
jgi:hypothetical protein